MPGVLPGVFPGYPGQTPAFAAIVADNVKTVELAVRGKRTDLPILNNSVYADLDFVGACDTLAVVTTYRDGGTRAHCRFTIPLPTPLRSLARARRAKTDRTATAETSTCSVSQYGGPWMRLTDWVRAFV